MANITKTASGFIFNNKPYGFEPFSYEENPEPLNFVELNTTQVLVGTDKGILFFDTSISIDNVTYEDSASWLAALFSE
tara:strand:+ start:1643 stop:1876 length:234 start_codon:yes stop_codon:yes gene_type:complete